MTNENDLSAWRLFLKIAETRSIGQAAILLDMDASTASRKLNRLERELGFPLFTRSTRAMTLTSEGKRRFRESVTRSGDLTPHSRNFVHIPSRRFQISPSAVQAVSLSTLSRLGQRSSARFSPAFDSILLLTTLPSIPTSAVSTCRFNVERQLLAANRPAL